MGFMCYYGHVQNTSNLGEGNVYKSYFLGALVELPCWSVPVIISKLGRRYSVTITNVTCPLTPCRQVAAAGVLHCERRGGRGVRSDLRGVAPHPPQCGAHWPHDGLRCLLHLPPGMEFGVLAIKLVQAVAICNNLRVDLHFNLYYLQYGSEIFPTVIRGQGVALCEIVGGVAIFVSPLVVYLVG